MKNKDYRKKKVDKCKEDLFNNKNYIIIKW